MPTFLTVRNRQTEEIDAFLARICQNAEEPPPDPDGEWAHQVEKAIRENCRPVFCSEVMQVLREDGKS